MLSTKALSTLLTMEWVRLFTDWIAYPTIAVGSIHHPTPSLLAHSISPRSSLVLE